MRVLWRSDRFDYILVETTGLANPGPVASIFWLDDELESQVCYCDALGDGPMPNALICVRLSSSCTWTAL